MDTIFPHSVVIGCHCYGVVSYRDTICPHSVVIGCGCYGIVIVQVTGTPFVLILLPSLVEVPYML